MNPSRVVETLVKKGARMVSRVIYRPFEKDDFSALASILKDTWHTYAPNQEYNALEAACDLVHSLEISSFSQVVLVDDVPCGIVLARAEGDRLPHAKECHAAMDAFLERMHKLEPKATDEYLSFLEAEQRVNSRLLEQSGLARASQITLLAVSGTARGLGIGSVLLDAATSYVTSRGAKGLYLYTDTDCSWKFYERRGLKRAAMYRANREERHVLPREMYLYGMDLSA